MAQRATAKTELFSQWTQGNLVIADEGQSTGSRWWVYSTTGSDTAGHGKSPDSPFATLDYASAACTASAGDIIYVMPGHAETITSATGCNLAIAGVRVVGLGSGSTRPTFTFTTANAATMTVDAANVSIENLVFVCGKDGQTAMLDVNAADCTVRGCEFRNDATYQAVTLIDLTSVASAAARLKVEDCRLISLTIGATQGIELGEVNDAVQIVGNYIWGDWSAAGIHNPTGKVLTNLLIKGNVVANLNTGEHAIELVSACTGMLIDNRMYGDTLGTILDPGSLYCAGNLEVDAIDQAGVDSPRTSAGGFPADSITDAVIAASAFTSDTFVDGWLDSTAFAASAFNSATFVDGWFDSTAFAANAFQSTHFQDGAIDSSVIGAGAFQSDVFEDGWLDSTAFAANAFQSTTFQDGAIDSSVLGAGAFQSDVFEDGWLDSTAFAANAFQSTTFQDGAIDSSVLGAGAFQSDVFEDGWLDSTAFAANAFQSTTFQDGAIDSSVLGAGAFQSDVFEDGWLDSTAFAANAFQSTTFQDDALDSTIFADNAATLLGRGVHVVRSTADLPANGTSSIFTIATGRVLLTGILGEVTTQIEVLANNTNLVANPSVGATSVNLCATADITGDETGAFFTITGTAGDSLQEATAGGIKFPVTPVVVAVGTIDLVTDTTATGAVKWDLWYQPLDEGATVTAT